MNARNVLRAALSRMGYRELEPGRWAKPVGYQLCVFEEQRRWWCNVFVSTETGRPAHWQVEEYDGQQDPLEWLKSREAESRFDVQAARSPGLELPADLGALL